MMYSESPVPFVDFLLIAAGAGLNDGIGAVFVLLSVGSIYYAAVRCHTDPQAGRTGLQPMAVAAALQIGLAFVRMIVDTAGFYPLLFIFFLSAVRLLLLILIL